MESAVASSCFTPPSVLPAGEYDVFLSFRGPDVRNTFADHLYTSLARSKIRTFRDEEELSKGEGIAPSLVRAIPESKIYIPILTQHYASSKWCLQELAQMVECWKLGKGHLILPIFYFVDPRDVRHQQGPYQHAFEQHDQRHSHQTVKEWKEALQEVGQMKGWHVTEFHGQGAVVEEVLSEVELHLRSIYTLVTDELVGINTHVEEVMKLLNVGSSEGKVIGIHGMGGIGKTTLSKAVYNKIGGQFDRSCFLEDLREGLTNGDGVVSLQNKVISSILKDDYQVKNVSEGINMIKERVCKYKVLVVIDDIDDNFEFDRVLGKLGDFSIDSRFIFTTRNKRALDFLPGCKSYEPRELNDHHSLKLFSKHAFGMDQPPEEYATIAEEFVKVAAGLPLALKVIGSLVFRRERKFWEEKLIELQNIPCTASKVQERLKVSYNELTHNEKQIFLDIACCFNRMEKDLPSYMWGGCNFHPESGINTLVLRSFIKIDERNRFWMHSHLRDLGKAIVIEEDIQHPYKRSRIWSTEDALNMLRNGEGNERVEVLRIHMGYEDRQLTTKDLTKLSGLRYLEVRHGGLTGDFRDILPKLCWLRLYRCKSIPTDLNAKKLAVLDLEGCPVKVDWRGWLGGIQAADKLKVINLSACWKLIKAPDLSQCVSLELINVGHCNKMEGRLHIGNLKNLKTLKLPCTHITELTGDIGMLQQLEEIDAHDSELVQLPVGIDNLSSLKILNLTSRFIRVALREMELARLPTSIKRLSLSYWHEVQNLGELKELEYLSFSGVASPVTSVYPRFPGELWKLPNLKELILWHSQDSDDAAAALPSSLTSLDVRNCWPLERLPSLANLNNLMGLKLRQVGMREIHGLGELRKLESMVISQALNLDNLNGLENLVLLKSLVVERCSALVRLPCLANTIKLVRLEVCKCRVLTEIKGLGGLRETLSHLQISHCPSLSSKVEGIEHLEALEELGLLTCGRWSAEILPSSLSKFGGTIRQLAYGEEPGDLPLTGWKYLKQFPDVSGLCNLKELSIISCRQLTEVTGLERLVSLESLIMVRCTSITTLPDLSELSNLEKLDVKGCTSLTDAAGIRRLESLRKLLMSGCCSITKLPNLSGLKNLETLNLTKCTALTEVQGIEGLESLTVLRMFGCTSMKELRNLSGLKNLKNLNIEGCTKLTKVKGLEELEGLERLEMGKKMRAKQLAKSAARYGKGIASRVVGVSPTSGSGSGTKTSLRKLANEGRSLLGEGAAESLRALKKFW